MRVKNEYPRPQFVRENWINLNGEWQFAFDDDDIGLAQRWYDQEHVLKRSITVPFVYQSQLSGIGEQTPHDIVWYKKKVRLERPGERERVILHFGAVDYQTWVYINGHMAASHSGGHTPFSIDITAYLEEEVTLAVRVYDPHKDEYIPRGKQFWEEGTRGIWYTNSTGIWQTVWLEYVQDKRLEDVKFTSRYDEGRIQLKCTGAGVGPDDRLCYRISFEGEVVARGVLYWEAELLDFTVDIIKAKIFHTNFHEAGRSWTPENPALHDVELIIEDADGQMCDKVTSYFGFRKVHTEQGMVYLNNKPYYQKLVLDQGYWPQGLLTAPEDEDFVKDIRLAKEMGFNGCRKHQKMEDPRFLYWADRLGFIVWGECASPIMYSASAVNRMLDEWAEVVDRDYNHPSILVWVPCNESWGIPNIQTSRKQQHFTLAMYHYLHAIDNTRLVISNDGWEMTKTDICAIHNYRHGNADETEVYKEYRDMLATRESLISHSSVCWNIYTEGYSNEGEPIMLTEFGGIGFDVLGNAGWGYTSVDSKEAFLADYGRIMDAVYASRGVWGFCYTQLTDVEQEINGLLTYDRRPKVSCEQICAINNQYHISRIVKTER